MLSPGPPPKVRGVKVTLTASSPTAAAGVAPIVTTPVGVAYCVVTTMNGEGGRVSETVENRVPPKVAAATTFWKTIGDLKKAGVRLSCSVPPSVAVPSTCRLS